VSTINTDEVFIRRAIELAMRGRGFVEPNPMVGCVLVKDGRVIGEGYHEKVGEAHAEPNALANCTEDPHGSTAYVTLEPCCHVNKRTPPCSPRLIEAGIARAVIGAIDPNPEVNGNGIAMLRAAGIDVTTGALERECNQLLAPFIAMTRYKRPYVTMKWAETADGKIAGPGGRRMRISGEKSNKVVHELRGRCDAILVGINTVLADDPTLTARDVVFSRLHTRFVLDSRLRIPMDCELVKSAGDMNVTIYFDAEAIGRNAEKMKALLKAGVRLVARHAGIHGRLRLPEILAHIAGNDVTHLLVEPGPTLAEGFFEANAVDRLWVIRSKDKLDDPTAPAVARVPDDFIPTGEIELAGDVLTEYLNPASPVFFAAEASADFRMATAV